MAGLSQVRHAHSGVVWHSGPAAPSLRPAAPPVRTNALFAPSLNARDALAPMRENMMERKRKGDVSELQRNCGLAAAALDARRCTHRPAQSRQVGCNTSAAAVKSEGERTSAVTR